MNCKILQIFLCLYGVAFLISCKDNEGCKNVFTVHFTGTILDNLSNPVQGASIKVSVNGSQPSEIAVSDVNGEYTYSWYRAAALGRTSIIVSKVGFSDFTSEEKQVGFSCADENVETNASLAP